MPRSQVGNVEIVLHRFGGRGEPFTRSVCVVKGLGTAQHAVNRLNTTLTDEEKASGLSHFLRPTNKPVTDEPRRAASGPGRRAQGRRSPRR